MAKVSTATVRLVLKKNRKNKNDEYPVYIVVCFGGRVEKATGVSVKEKYWDAKREVIKAGCPNAPVLNRMLLDVKQKVLDRKSEYEYAGKRYTPQMLLENSVIDLHANDSDFWSVCQRIIDERRLRDGTIRTYTYTYKKMCEFLKRKNFIVDELTLGVVKDFATWLEKTGIKINTIKRLLSCVAAVWNFAIQKKLVDADGYPFGEFQYTQKYKEVPRDYYLEASHIVRLKNYWMDMVVVQNGKRWHYRPGAEERLHQRWTAEWGILWFLLMYKFGGAAPADVALLRPSCFTRETLDEEEYWKLEFRRKKTDRAVKYMIKRDVFSIVSIDHFLGMSGHYVYPIIKYTPGITDKQILSQSHHVSKKAIEHVREAFLHINDDIARENAENHTNEPLVDVSRVVMYTARHSRASNYFNSPGATIGSLASMLGRSANTIAVYAHFLKSNKDVAKLDDNCVI